jgi:aryl-alcohol dehydrogenase-like predicted oxidoreductase
MKLALGTAQLGLDYGVANATGKITPGEARAVMACARESSIEMLDTAVAYGDSEQRLGQLDITGFEVVSKLPPVPEDVINLRAWVFRLVRQSLDLLRVRRLYGLLLHRPLQLNESRGREIADALEAVKAEGLVFKTGFSVHAPADLDALYPTHQPDMVQAPLNLFDTRLVQSGWMQRLHTDGVELHVRSIFLQGLLLIPPAERPERFARWAEHFALYDAWMNSYGRDAIEACVGFALSFPEISRVVVGVDTAAQLRRIVAAARTGPIDHTPSLGSPDPDLLNPLVWMRQ